MHWNNHHQPTFSQSHEFQRNQLSSQPTTPSTRNDTDLTTQKNLICDLRSELSSLKS